MTKSRTLGSRLKNYRREHRRCNNGQLAINKTFEEEFVPQWPFLRLRELSTSAYTRELSPYDSRTPISC
jgi:hypothetical protein